jgi:hypothetical protein
MSKGWVMAPRNRARAARLTSIAVPLCLILGSASPTFAQIESRIGTWELNPQKSTFSPGPPPRRQTLTFKKAGPQWVALLQGVEADGRPINPDMNNLAINFDGKDHPTANVDYDTTVWKIVNSSTYEVIRKRAGKIVLTSVNTLSADGATMTITTRGHDAAGQEINNVRVYERR